ncbi:MAG: amidohydrolase [Spirochaetia bacterium]|jgi:5-methylthioadenosine/S-adenosylhomocysteine deaminase|nr:amidohydrolase [Spirochaetia bacterium]
MMAEKQLLLQHATIVTVDNERRVLFDSAMVVKGKRIVAIGPDDELSARYQAQSVCLDCTGKVIFPGFINTHNHLFQTLLKGLGDDMVLSDWLHTMTFPAARYLEPEDCRYGALLGVMEGIHSGITTQVDYMYPHPRGGLSDGIIDTFSRLKIRGVFGRGCMNTGTEFGVVPEIMQDVPTVEKDLLRLLDTYGGSCDGRISIWAAPAALWSNTADMLKMLYEVVNSYHTGLTVHVSETPFDRKATQALHGCAGVDCLEKLGLVGPNILMVHCVYLTESDMEKAAAYDLKVSHNPVSNMYLASGVAPIPEMLGKNITVGLGVDGAASNNGQDMLELMKTTALLQKVHTLNPTVITAEKVLEMATIDGARALGMEKEIGSLEVGKKADFVIFNPKKSAKAVPMHNPVSTLVYSSTVQNIESVAIDGEFVLQDGLLTTVEDEENILYEAQNCADDLAVRAHIVNRGKNHHWYRS